MTLFELIEQATAAIGSYGQLAEKLGCHQNRITEWKKGTAKPDASKIACMAEMAKLPILETVAEIESQVDERHAEIWRAALGKLRAAGVAAAYLFLVLQTAGGSAKAHANQMLSTNLASNLNAAKIYIVGSKRALLAWLKNAIFTMLGRKPITAT